MRSVQSFLLSTLDARNFVSNILSSINQSLISLTLLYVLGNVILVKDSPWINPDNYKIIFVVNLVGNSGKSFFAGRYCQEKTRMHSYFHQARKSTLFMHSRRIKRSSRVGRFLGYISSHEWKSIVVLSSSCNNLWIYFVVYIGYCLLKAFCAESGGILFVENGLI